MTRDKLLDEIECRKIATILEKYVPKAVSMNEKTKEKIGIDIKVIYGLEIFIDGELADDEIRILRK